MARKTLSQLIDERVGVSTEAVTNPKVTAIGTTAEPIVGHNPNRVSLLIVNLGAGALYISPDIDASSSHGIRLSPNGGSFALTWEEDMHLCAYEWYAVSDAAANAVFVVEVQTR